MEFFTTNHQNDKTPDVPVLYPQLQPPTAPSKKCSFLKIREPRDVHGRLKSLTSIIVIILLVVIVSLGCLAIALFSDRTSSSSQVCHQTSQETEDIFERNTIEFRRRQWAVLSGSIVAQATCKQRPFCQDFIRTHEFSHTSSHYVLWVDRVLRVSHFQRDYVGTLVTRVKCITPKQSDKYNATMIDFNTVWDVTGSEVILPNPEQLGRALVLQVIDDNRNSRRQFDFNITSIVVEGVYRSKDDDIAKQALRPVTIQCPRNF